MEAPFTHQCHALVSFTLIAAVLDAGVVRVNGRACSIARDAEGAVDSCQAGVHRMDAVRVKD